MRREKRKRRLCTVCGRPQVDMSTGLCRRCKVFGYDDGQRHFAMDVDGNQAIVRGDPNMSPEQLDALAAVVREVYNVYGRKTER